MKKLIILCASITLLTATSASAFTEPYPGSIRFTGDVTCPAAYPVKTGESTLGGGYITTCYTSQAWSLYLAGGDDWAAWLAGTWTPAPTPTPTITITATPEPVISVQYVDRVVSDTRVVTEYVPCKPKDLTTAKKIRAEIKKLQKALKRQIRQEKSAR